MCPSARWALTTETKASMTASAPSGDRTRRSPVTRPSSSRARASSLVPPRSMPTVRAISLKAQEGADASEHVEVGVFSADLQTAGLVEGLLHRLFHDIVGMLHP